MSVSQSQYGSRDVRASKKRSKIVYECSLVSPASISINQQSILNGLSESFKKWVFTAESLIANHPIESYYGKLHKKNGAAGRRSVMTMLLHKSDKNIKL